jgi:hypothetical protein
VVPGGGGGCDGGVCGGWETVAIVKEEYVAAAGVQYVAQFEDAVWEFKSRGQ